MKFLKISFLFLSSFLFLFHFNLYGKDNFPKPQGPINDFASVIPQDIEARMEALSYEILQKTGTAIVVVTLKDVGNNEPDLYANELYEAWGIGKKGEDKGVLILLALKERRVRIETGYGVEGILPDGLVGSILDRYVVPYLKKGEYGIGLLNGMIAISRIIAKDAGVTLTGKYNPIPFKTSRKRTSMGYGIIPLFFLFFLLLPLFSRSRMGAFLPLFLLVSMGGRGGGFSGGFGGGFGGFGGGLSGGGGAGRGF